jgi:prepilin-type N-terminal cleavage/methylation domain-containing protein
MRGPDSTLIRQAAFQSGQGGVTLVELVVSVLIFSIIAVAGSMFLSLAMHSYLVTNQSAGAAQAAPNTLDRLGLEFRTATGLGGGSTVTLVPDVSLQYETTDPNLPGTRSLSLSGGDLYLSENGTPRLLLEDVTDFQLRVEQNDTDGDSSNQEISAINVSFRINGTGAAYTLRVTPREFIRL